MKYLKFSDSNLKPAIINLIVGSLKNDKVLVLPTDTIYGLSCLADSLAAIKTIYSLKKRDCSKPLIVLVSSLEMLRKYVFLSKQQELILKTIWKKESRPTTIILKQRKILPSELSGGLDSLALRLPKSNFLIRIIKKLGKPLVSTSLNLSGQKNISNLRTLDDYFSQQVEKVALVIDCGPSIDTKASRLIDLRQATRPIIIRK